MRRIRSFLIAAGALIALLALADLFEILVLNNRFAGKWIFLAAFVLPPLTTIYLPRKWLALWLPLITGSVVWFVHALATTDGGGGMIIALYLVRIFLIVNVPIAIARIMFAVADGMSALNRGYIDRG